MDYEWYGTEDTSTFGFGATDYFDDSENSPRKKDAIVAVELPADRETGIKCVEHHEAPGHRCMDHTQEPDNDTLRSFVPEVDSTHAKHLYMSSLRSSFPFVNNDEVNAIKVKTASASALDKAEWGLIASVTDSERLESVMEKYNFKVLPEQGDHSNRSLMTVTVPVQHGLSKHLFEEELTMRTKLKTESECKVVFLTKYVPKIFSPDGKTAPYLINVRDLFLDSKDGAMSVPFYVSLDTELPLSMGRMVLKGGYFIEENLSSLRSIPYGGASIKYAPTKAKYAVTDQSLLESVKTDVWYKNKRNIDLKKPDVESSLFLRINHFEDPEDNSRTIAITSFYIMTVVSFRTSSTSHSNMLKRINANYRDKVKVSNRKPLDPEDDARLFDERYGNVSDEALFKSVAAFMDIFRKPPVTLLYSADRFADTIKIKSSGGVDGSARMEQFFTVLSRKDELGLDARLRDLGFSVTQKKLKRGSVALSNSGFSGFVKKVSSTFVPAIKDMDYNVWVTTASDEEWTVLQFPLTKFNLDFKDLFKDKVIDRDHARGFTFTFENKGETKKSVDRRVRLKVLIDSEEEGFNKYFFGLLESKRDKKKTSTLMDTSMVVLQKDKGISTNAKLQNLLVILKQSAYEFI